MSGKPFDDAAKKRLAQSIISGKDANPDNVGDTATVRTKTTLPDPDEATEQFEGEHDGHIRIEQADNGVMISHDRRKKAAHRHGSDVGPSHESTSVKKVFQVNDHKGMSNHIMSIIKSPMRRSGY